ncbi:MAG: pyridoxal-phosphate dependent enzyme [Chloroflexaceae bacterium]|nr:pyridoxal-phosphate dependent enzyme [Chloroflexaceae bacterium]
MAYSYRLTLGQINAAAAQIDPVFLDTPQYINEPLSTVLGVRLVLKIETLNPIRCFKGRGADLLVAQLTDTARLICASAGNFGQAMAYACRKRGVALTVYASTTANPQKVERMRALGAEVVLHGHDFDAAKAEARRAAAAQGIRFVEDSRDLETVAGAATMGLELLTYPESLDALLIALGNGAMFNGVARVFKAYQPTVQMIAVQAIGAPAMIESYRTGTLYTTTTADTIADGIAVRVPVPEALADMHGLADETLLVQDATIITAMRLLHEHAGLVVEPSGAVGIAALLEHPARFAGQTVATIICGGNMNPAQMREWL